MDNESPITTHSAAPGPSNSELLEQVTNLRRLLVVTLLIIVAASFPLNIYLMSQVRPVSRELTRMREQRPQLEQAVAQYQNNAQPLIENLLRDLNTYAKARPQLLPLLQKYRIQQPREQPSPAAPSTGATTSTAPASVQ